MPDQTSTGTAREGEAQTVPVVDITQVVRDLYEQAEECRVRRQHALALAASLARQATYLESVADTFAGVETKT